MLPLQVMLRLFLHVTLEVMLRSLEVTFLRL